MTKSKILSLSCLILLVVVLIIVCILDKTGNYNRNITNTETSVEASTQVEDETITPSNYSISLTEYMTANKSKVADNYGDTPNWIELHNDSSEVADLSNMVLSETSDGANQYTIPSGVTLQPNEYMVVWFDGLGEYSDGNLHASFKLPNCDTQIILTDSTSNVILQTPLTYIDSDVSISYGENSNLVYYNTPTPNAENSTTAYSSIDDATSLSEKAIYFSEVSAFPTDDDYTEDFDWIELYNNSNEDINLDGWTVSKKFNSDDEDDYYTFSNVTIGAGQYLILYATGKVITEDTEYIYSDDDDEERIYLNDDSIYLPFKIGVDGEKLYLFNSDGNCVDYFKSQWTEVGDSCGRVGTVDSLVYFDIPTPAGLNNTATYKGYAEMPELSNDGGYATVGETITVDIPSGVTIYYTDDGTEPTEDSPVFTGYTIQQNCVLRFLVHQDGCLPSTIYSSTYIVSESHTIPIVAISTDADGLYSDENGIFAYGYDYDDEFPYKGANFWQDWERVISFEYYDENGEKQLNCLAGATTFGAYSRAYVQKSIALNFRGKYGTSSVEYPFFEGNDVTKFSSLVLRAGGQDQEYCHLRDAFIAEVASEYSDVACMDWQPVAVYINGEYYGCYNLREKINASYFKNHEGIDEDDISIIKDGSAVKGSTTSYKELISYIREHDLSVQEYYDYVASKLDIENYTDYLITEIFFGNEDGGSNIKRYVDESGGKWRFVLYDMDMSTYAHEYNSMKAIFSPYGSTASDMDIEDIQSGLTQNDGFNEYFIQRYAELLNSYFMPENLIAKFDYMTSLIDDEMVLHGVRWSAPTYSDWVYNVDKFKGILEDLRDTRKEELIDYFDLSSSEVAELFPND